jgi:hypothetical protein
MKSYFCDLHTGVDLHESREKEFTESQPPRKYATAPQRPNSGSCQILTEGGSVDFRARPHTGAAGYF